MFSVLFSVVRGNEGRVAEIEVVPAVVVEAPASAFIVQREPDGNILQRIGLLRAEERNEPCAELADRSLVGVADLAGRHVVDHQRADGAGIFRQPDVELAADLLEVEVRDPLCRRLGEIGAQKLHGVRLGAAALEREGKVVAVPAAAGLLDRVLAGAEGVGEPVHGLPGLHEAVGGKGFRDPRRKIRLFHGTVNRPLPRPGIGAHGIVVGGGVLQSRVGVRCAALVGNGLITAAFAARAAENLVAVGAGHGTPFQNELLRLSAGGNFQRRDRGEGGFSRKIAVFLPGKGGQSRAEDHKQGEQKGKNAFHENISFQRYHSTVRRRMQGARATRRAPKAEKRQRNRWFSRFEKIDGQIFVRCSRDHPAEACRLSRDLRAKRQKTCSSNFSHLHE